VIKSLRWKLEFFYAGLLAFLIVSIGSLLYFQVWHAVYDEFDQRLIAAALYLDLALRPMPAEPGRVMAPPPRPDGSRPPPPRTQEQFLKGIKLPEELNLYQQSSPLSMPVPDLKISKHYFLIYSNQGELLKQENLPEGYLVQEVGDEIFTERPTLKTVFNNKRETYMRGPRNTRIIVGKSLIYIKERLGTFAFRIILVGSFFMAVGIFFSFAIASRISKPLAQMSAAAEQISEKNLSTPLDITQVNSELSGLVKVLNNLFARLDASLNRQKQFTADASHELRTPLAVIRSISELTLSQTRTPKEYQEAIEISLKAVHRMTKLVNGLLALARVDSYSEEFTVQEIEFDCLVLESILLLTPMATEKQISITHDLNPVKINGHKASLTQVLDNLITNAIIYNKVGGEINLKLIYEKGIAILEITDTGIGISQDQLTHLFERFYRVDKARSRLTGGSGLGLSICKALVEKHQGVIKVNSIIETGTTFRIEFPLQLKV